MTSLMGVIFLAALPSGAVSACVLIGGFIRAVVEDALPPLPLRNRPGCPK